MGEAKGWLCTVCAALSFCPMGRLTGQVLAPLLTRNDVLRELATRGVS